MKTILVPLDGSVRAERVLPYARRFASILHAKLCLLKIVPDTHEDDLPVSAGVEMYRHASGPTIVQRERMWRSWEVRRRHAAGYLESHAIMLQSEGIYVDFDVRLGNPAEEIAAAAESKHIAMIAMATHGYGGMRRWSLGSVTDKVLHSAAVPVFVMRDAEQAPPDEIAIKRIVVPLDGSDLARQALPLASRLAIGAGAELTLLQAIAPAIEAFPGIPPRGQPIAQTRDALVAMRAQGLDALGAIAEELRQQDVPATAAVANGYAAEVIVEEAERRQADLIVMATHGYSGIRRWALGSVADKVLHSATTPIVVVRAR